MSINLENFEYKVEAQKTPHVLTSPRSLEACSILRIQPVDLVYKNLEEYEETLADLPLSEIYRIYESDETERQSRLLKCRELRKKFISEENLRRSSRFKGKATSRTMEYPSKMAEFGGSDTEVNYGSETESHEGNSGDYVKKQHFQNQNRQRNSNLIPIHSSVNLNSNIDFKKLSSSPRHFCSCHFDLNDEKIVKEYMQTYGGFTRSMDDLSLEDKKILEILLLKEGKQKEWDKQSHFLRRAIENEKNSEFRRHQLKAKAWAERLAEKRHLENVENTSRYLTLDREVKERRLHLLKYIDERDSKAQAYLDRIQYQKRKQLIERHRNDALRQLEVGKAIDRLLEADKIQRLQLAEKLQRRMRESEIRRKRREMDNLRHLSEMNRLEDAKRELKLERLDQEARLSTEILRNQIEEKEHRATMNYLANLRLRNTILSHGAGNRNLAIAKTQKAHSELLQGLQEWNKKVFELHLAAQERATMNHYAEINRRRTRAATERVLREERNNEILRRVKEMEDQRIEFMKALIESKNFRSARLKEQKEQQLHESRLRAQLGAELREALRQKLNPETFDKKAARAEIESQLLQKHPSRTVRFSNETPRTNVCTCSCCHCSCSCNSVLRRHNNIYPVPERRHQ